MIKDLQNKRALITGSTTGIGQAVAGRFARAGAIVYVNGRSDDRVEDTVASLSSLGRVFGAVGDVASLEEANSLYAQVTQDGPLDILVNNVGVRDVKAFDDISDDDWFHYFNVNVMSAVRLSRRALPDMIQRRAGRIINVASDAGVKPWPQMLHYSVTKSALLGLSRGLAELTRGTEVTVNALVAGPTWTEEAQAYLEKTATQEGKSVDLLIHEYFRRHDHTSLIQRFVDLDEVAEAAYFVATVSGVNGSALRVEGGTIRTIV